MRQAGAQMKPVRSIGQPSVARPGAEGADSKNRGASRPGAVRPVIVWFRQDLRLGDNPALRAAAATGAPILPLFVLDEGTPGDWKWGGASRWWLHHSLAALDKSLKGHLVLRRGDAAKIVLALAKSLKAQAVVWNRCYEPFALARDRELADALGKAGVTVQTFNAALLHEPWEIKNK